MLNWPVLIETQQVQFEEKVCGIAICESMYWHTEANQKQKNIKLTPSKLKGRALHWPK